MPVFKNLANPSLIFGSQGYAFHQGIFETSDKEAISTMKKTEDYANGHIVELSETKDSKPKAKAPEADEPVTSGETAPKAPEQLSEFDSITANQIKARLDEIGIGYDPSSKKQELFDLMKSAELALASQGDETVPESGASEGGTETA